MELLECVPNLSEGRRLAVVDRLEAAASAAGARLLDSASDADHHRTVLTLAGDPDDLRRTILALASVAIVDIDLRHHRGQHPRVGALDVVPFVPLHQTAMATAIHAARATAHALTERYGLPSFLYGAAAKGTPRTLAELRRGGWRGLQQRIESGELSPDFGYRVHPTAGAVLVGARPLLVAFNLVLDTADASVAREIARAIRQSTPGGLPGILALGLPLASRRRAQVSVNVVDVEATSLLELVTRVEQEAERRGSALLESELVGLAPEIAVRGASAEQLRLPSLGPEQILEQQLAKQGLLAIS